MVRVVGEVGLLQAGARPGWQGQEGTTSDLRDVRTSFPYASFFFAIGEAWGCLLHGDSAAQRHGQAALGPRPHGRRRGRAHQVAPNEGQGEHVPRLTPNLSHYPQRSTILSSIYFSSLSHQTCDVNAGRAVESRLRSRGHRHADRGREDAHEGAGPQQARARQGRLRRQGERNRAERNHFSSFGS